MDSQDVKFHINWRSYQTVPNVYEFGKFHTFGLGKNYVNASTPFSLLIQTPAHDGLISTHARKDVIHLRFFREEFSGITPFLSIYVFGL